MALPYHETGTEPVLYSRNAARLRAASLLRCSCERGSTRKTVLLRQLITEAACYLWREFFFSFLPLTLFLPIARVLSRIGLRASVPPLVCGALLPPNSRSTFVESSLVGCTTPLRGLCC